VRFSVKVYVLNNFTRHEAPIINAAIDLAAEAAEV
jgi:peptidyl-tRNA hydrolase